MPNTQNIALVKACIPALEEHGLTLTQRFYTRLFEHHPSLRSVFNQGQQRSGSQQHALAHAVLAYARHIDNPMVLAGALERIANKHTSLGIRPEHYDWVGAQLLGAIGDVMGEAATPEVISAWAWAYQQLAQVLIKIEADMYQKTAQQPAGWTGWREFRVINKHQESSVITSFELQACDGGTLPVFKPGQYVSTRLYIPSLGMRQTRQYSLSCAPGQNTWRISVKREDGTAESPSGWVSPTLHGHINVGDVLELAAPAGDFFLHEDDSLPVVLISGGVGITPMMSMLQHVARQGSTRQVDFLHAALSPAHLAFSQDVPALVTQLQNGRSHLAIEHNAPENTPSNGWSANCVGRLNLRELPWAINPQAHYYVCGPAAFMDAQIQTLRALGVASHLIHAERFGSGAVSVE